MSILKDIYSKEYLDSLEKGGVGSGIVGHTSSGKAIYRKMANEYSNFSEQDHKDAADFHHLDSKRSKQGIAFSQRSKQYRDSHVDAKPEDKESYFSYDKDTKQQAKDDINRSMKKSDSPEDIIGLNQYTNQSQNPYLVKSFSHIPTENEIREVLKDKLTKGVIDQDLYDKAISQIDSLVKSGVGSGKKGEGSRGGKVVGHDHNGKPIYEHSMAKHFKHDSNYVIKHERAGEDKSYMTIGKKDGSNYMGIGGDEKTGYYVNTHSGNIADREKHRASSDSNSYPWNHKGDDEGRAKYGHYRYTEEGAKKLISGYGIHAKNSAGHKADQQKEQAANNQKKKQIEHHEKMRDFHDKMAGLATNETYGRGHERNQTDAILQVYKQHNDQARYHHSESERLKNEK